MSSPPNVLIFTYPEHGQANVNLATAYELALAGVNVHIASFAPLKDRVLRLQELIVRHTSRSSSKPTGSVVFHECKGITPYMQAAAERGMTPANLPHSHGVQGAVESYAKLLVMAFPWTEEAYLDAIECIKEIVTTVKPDVVVIDMIFYYALDACRLLNQKFMVILPTSVKDVAINLQPHLTQLWKYPALSSGFAFPLKWWQIFVNIYLVIQLVIHFVTTPKFKKVQAIRGTLGFKPMFSDQPYPGVTYICPALVETDLPYAVIPEQIRLCGPIVLPFDPLEQSDPALVEWLDNGPTVMINLGSHAVSDVNLAREVASAIRILLNYHDQKRSNNNIQVIWKVKASEDTHAVIKGAIGKEMKAGRVKVVAWLEAEPIAILQHPNLVCTVHHGGANSFYEGILSGVPHIVLPAWLDTFDYATRVEYLNIGIFASKSSAPGVRAEEFGQALVRVTGDGAEATKFKSAAKRFKDLCRTKGNGRELSASAILKEIGVRK